MPVHMRRSFAANVSCMCMHSNAPQPCHHNNKQASYRTFYRHSQYPSAAQQLLHLYQDTQQVPLFNSAAAASVPRHTASTTLQLSGCRICAKAHSRCRKLLPPQPLLHRYQATFSATKCASVHHNSAAATSVTRHAANTLLQLVSCCICAKAHGSCGKLLPRQPLLRWYLSTFSAAKCFCASLCNSSCIVP
jgi:hypothetical protein